MPPARKQNVCVVLFDMKMSNDFTAKAKQCLLEITAKKAFFNSHDLVMLVLFNTEETKNISTCYKNIYQATELRNYTFDFATEYFNDVNPGDGNWLEALLVAIELFKIEFADIKNIICKQILLFSDFNVSPKINDIKIQDIINGIKTIDAYLYILVPNIDIPLTLTSVEDIRAAMSALDIDNIKSPNLSAAKEIAVNSNGVLCTPEIGAELFFFYKDHKTSQPWLVPLSIGTTLEIPTSTFRCIKEPGSMKFQGGTTSYKDWKWVKIDDIGEECDFNNILRGVVRHEKFVSFMPEVTSSFKCMGERSFKILGFTEASNIPEYYLRGDGASYIFPDSRNKNSEKLFYSLLYSLDDQAKYAVARKVTMKNCRPKLMALIPDIKRNCFFMSELPFADDIRILYKEYNPSEAPPLEAPEKMVQEVYDFCNKVNLSRPNKVVTDAPKLPLWFNFMSTPYYKTFVHRATQKYLDNDYKMNVNEPEINPLNGDLLSDKDLEGLKAWWPEREPIAAKSRSKAGINKIDPLEPEEVIADEVFPF